jgi:hypothetical protein
LTPGNSFKEWIFEENVDNSHVFADMLSYIKMYGFEYFEQMASLNNALEAFIKGNHTNSREVRDRNVPILYYLIGDKRKGLEFIEAALERQKTPLSEAQMARLIKLAGPGGQVFIGGGIGKVDPEYLKFIERYNELT